jgi:excisionase family DNA binding protein
MSQLLTIEQVAEQLQVPVDTLYYWRSKKAGPAALKVGKYLRWRQEDVDAWLATLAPGSNVIPITGPRSKSA